VGCETIQTTQSKQSTFPTNVSSYAVY